MARMGGLASLQRAAMMQEGVRAYGAALTREREAHVEEQIGAFKTHLEEFARKHRVEINKDPEFRRAFAQMCKSIGVDPLASSKGFWSEILNVGDFYYELGVQIVDVCLRTRGENGGLIALSELTDRVRRMRGGSGGRAGVAHDAAMEVSEGDIRRALKQLAVLGGGYRELLIGRTRFVVSVPAELRDDHSLVLRRCLASAKPFTTVSELAAAMSWAPERCAAALDALLKTGMAWLDAPPGAKSEPRFYFPALMSAVTTTAVAAARAAAPESTAAGGVEDLDDDDNEGV